MLTKINIEYQTNYNGCSVFCYFNGDEENGFDNFDVDQMDSDLHIKVKALQEAVVNEAYEDVIKEGRLEGTFNGNTAELEVFAVAKAKEMFGDSVNITFEVDYWST